MGVQRSEGLGLLQGRGAELGRGLAACCRQLALPAPDRRPRRSLCSPHHHHRACSAHGFMFDHGAFAAAHQRKARVAAFLQLFRASQMLEVFITERLRLASEGYATDDPFELKVGWVGGVEWCLLA